MADYIRREDALAKAERDSNFCLVVPFDALERIPVADVAPVVRCKGCANSRVTESGIRYCKAPLGMYGAVPVEDDYFCSNGKRQDDGGNENEND